MYKVGQSCSMMEGQVDSLSTTPITNYLKKNKHEEGLQCIYGWIFCKKRTSVKTLTGIAQAEGMEGLLSAQVEAISTLISQKNLAPACNFITNVLILSTLLLKALTTQNQKQAVTTQLLQGNFHYYPFDFKENVGVSWLRKLYQNDKDIWQSLKSYFLSLEANSDGFQIHGVSQHDQTFQLAPYTESCFSGNFLFLTSTIIYSIVFLFFFLKGA